MNAAVYLPSNLRCHSLLRHPSPAFLKLSHARGGVKVASIARGQEVPARDRVIDFGKYKGKMLGTVPSNYLKWVTKNLRAGDTKKWAKLADEVLDDPVYRDRIEWEVAQRVLSGDGMSSSAMAGRAAPNAATELLEISQRFGWDFDDKAAWSKIDFGLLGTSMGGRIPRVSDSGSDNRNVGTCTEPKPRQLKTKKGGDGEADTESRERRRERLRAAKTGVSAAVESPPKERMAKLKILETSEGNFGSADGQRDSIGNRVGSGNAPKTPFPGREALLKKALSRRRLS